MKSFGNALVGLAILAALVLCGIGSIGYLIYDHHYLFAIATLVVVIFAAPTMYREIQKRLLL
jgi:hypothetical protein